MINTHKLNAKTQTQNDRNIKYRRKKNFIKKGVQLSQICDVEVIILTYDRKLNKLDEFYTTPSFRIDNVNKMIDQRVNEKKELVKYR